MLPDKYIEFHRNPQNKTHGGIKMNIVCLDLEGDRKSTRLNSSHASKSRMPSSA